MTTSANPIANPSWRLVLGSPAHFIAFGFGIGKIPVAPGTWGTLAAFPLYYLLHGRLEAYEFLALVGVMFAVGVWACHATGKMLRCPDHGGMVWDEMVAFLLVLFLTPDGPLWQAFAFLLFRLFDILKPPPIRYYDRRIKNGFGVMLDDLMAGFYTVLCLAVWRALAG